MISNKRGISPVVAEVLLVLLGIAAVGIVAGFVIPFVKDNLNKSTECLSYRDYFSFQEVFKYGTESYRYNCRDSDGDAYGISIKANSDVALAKNIAGFSIVFARPGLSKVIRVDNETIVEGLILMGHNSGTELEVPRAGEVKTYVYSSEDSFDKIEVYPVLKSGRICEMSDSIDIVECSSNIDLGAGE